MTKYSWLLAIYLLVYATLSALVLIVVFTQEIVGVENSSQIITALIALYIIVHISRQPPLNDRSFWKLKSVIAAAVLANIGHLGLLFGAYLLHAMMNAGPGSTSGLMLFPPLLWMFIFYLLAMALGSTAVKIYMKK